MTASATTALRRTPFYDIHRALNARIVPFAGYEMPVTYPTGITAEHNAVRTQAGLFDVSHMGEFVIRGERMVEFVNYVTTNDVEALADGQGLVYAGVPGDPAYNIALPVWLTGPLDRAALIGRALRHVDDANALAEIRESAANLCSKFQPY